MRALSTLGWRALAQGFGLGNHIHSGQPEERSGGEEVFIVGMDFGEAVFCGSSQMEGGKSEQDGTIETAGRHAALLVRLQTT